MLSAIFLMLSQYNANKKKSNIFKIIWVLYEVVISIFNFHLNFLLVSIMTFILVTCFIYVISHFFQSSNILFSVISILIYSLFIDIACYFFHLYGSLEQSLIQYIVNGFAFNYRYVFSNAIFLSIIILYQIIFRKCQIKDLNVNELYNKRRVYNFLGGCHRIDNRLYFLQ